MRRVLSFVFGFVFAMVATIAVVAPTPAGACSCAPPSTEVEAFTLADAVFVGSVEQIYDARTGDSGNPQVVVMRVSDVYKGDVTETQGIVTSADGASCGFDFVVGEAYVVFSASTDRTDEGFYESALCDGTRLLGDDTPELSVAPGLPQAGGPTVALIQDQLGHPRTSIVPEMLILAVVLAFVLGLAGWFSRKNRPAI